MVSATVETKEGGTVVAPSDLQLVGAMVDLMESLNKH